MVVRRDAPFAQVVVPDHKALDRGTRRDTLRLSIGSFSKRPSVPGFQDDRQLGDDGVQPREVHDFAHVSHPMGITWLAMPLAGPLPATPLGSEATVRVVHTRAR